ncbi:unnamed protein product [Bursaphelenchus okinawaensis]|uniref:Abnormal cell migration protein 18-like fibronectin type I domain-containing protein n=1 Tax=Bursaphelenchus okinawaensis TaxID=465554 RepID=A0A811LSU3_9BILA|nr:unnamed protein product [Bursaphelenchus okinawaensis]CAG9127542.1 unnamed protein product [Bursaphelenchus okinawaensis]
MGYIADVMLPLLLLLLCSVVDSTPFTKSEGRNVSPQQYAVIMEHFLGGSKNVRWETMPMSTLDQNGKPVKGLGNSDCMDVQGQTRKNGEEYDRPSHRFKFICKDGEEQVTACIGSSRSNNARIPVGSNVEVDGFWHKCQSFPNGSVVYFQEPSCRDMKGKELHIGDEFTAGYLRLACDDGGYKTVGCVFHGKDGEVILREGETRDVGKVSHHCENVNGNLEYFSKASGCTKLDRNLNEGDTFSENHLHYKCENGLAQITGCYVSEHKDLSIGQDLEENGVLHRCYRAGGAVEYEEFPCHGESCHPKPVDSGSEGPVVSQGQDKSRGFGAFAIVQRIGDKVQSPSTMKFDLDKLLMRSQG